MNRTSRVILKWLLLAGLLTYTVGMTVWASHRANERVCPGIKVEITGTKPGIEKIVRQGVLEHLAVLGPVKGRTVGELNLRNIQNWMNRLENLEQATCAFLPDGTLLISAQALVPEMRVFGPGGASYYVNRDGKHMEARQEFFTDVPVVYGRFDKNLREKSLIPLVHAINGDPLLADLITMIEVRSPQNIILIPRMQGHIVNFGDTTRVNAKLTALKAFYRKVMPYRGWNTYEQLSLKYAGRVIATLRVKPAVPETVIDSIPDPEELALQQSQLEEHPEAAPLTNNPH